MSIRLFLICCIVMPILLAGCAATPAPDSTTIAVETDDMRGMIVFSSTDRARIKQFYRSAKNAKHIPPGLARKDKLPPGLQKHIIERGTLPPGLEGRRLPVTLERTLSPLKPGYIRLRIGGDVFLLDEKTRVVFDVIWNVLP